MLQSIQRSVGATRPLRGTRPRRAWILLAATGMCLALLMMSAAPGQAARAKYWKGKDISAATKKYGEPLQKTPIPDTGGTLYIFHHDKHDWVFETNPDGKIVIAVKVR